MDFSIVNYFKMDGESVNVGGRNIFRLNNLSVKNFLSEIYNFSEINYPKFFKMDLISKAGILGAEYLLKGRENLETAIFLANSSSSLDTDRNYQKTIGDDSYFPSPSLFVYTLPNIVLGEIAIKHKLYGESLFYVLDDFDTQAIFDYFCNAAKNSRFEQAIIGWIECTENNCDVMLMLVECKKGVNEFNINNINIIRNERIG
jgi:hypothetical protein